MRTFKFRAWDKTKKILSYKISFYPYQDQSTKGGEVFVGDNRVSQYFPEEVELTQFTGLFDKNGKEIYEGDILKRKGFIYFVEWGQVEAGFYLIDTPPKSDLIGMTTYFANDSKEYEIIGNIFANPELLKNL